VTRRGCFGFFPDGQLGCNAVRMSAPKNQKQSCFRARQSNCSGCEDADERGLAQGRAGGSHEVLWKQELRREEIGSICAGKKRVNPDSGGFRNEG